MNSMKRGDLTDQQRRFCEEYVKDFNVTQAMLRAGYSENYANKRSNFLLGNVGVQNYLQSLRDGIENRAAVSLERVLSEYAKIAFFDIRKLCDDNGEVLPIGEIDDETAGAIIGIEVATTSIGSDTVSVNVKKVRMSDKRAALDSICRIMGYNAPEKHDHVINKFSGFNFLPDDEQGK